MSAISFYTGMVTHQRFSGPGHKLRYRIAYVLLDLERIEEANAASRWLGVGARGLMSVRARDHGDGKCNNLAEWAREYIARRGITQAAAHIELLTLPRMFGYVFNPLSVYFIYDGAGALHHILYEVNNTHGDRHFYLCRVDHPQPIIRQSSRKSLPVSPFFDVEGQYFFRVRPPTERVVIGIDYVHDSGKKALSATLTGRRKSVTNMSALQLLLSFPLMTLGVVVCIHWEALKLYLKGAPLKLRKSAGSKSSTETGSP